MTPIASSTAEAGVPDVAVVVAFYKPVIADAARQLESLRGQTNVSLRIIAVLDGPETVADEELGKLLALYQCRIVTLPEQHGVRRAFAAGLAAALTEPAGLFAYCDQDDVWDAAKLERTCAALQASGAMLAHCDARVITDEHRVIAPSLYRYESRREPADLLGMLLLNTVTGMTAVFTRAVAEAAVPLCAKFTGQLLLHDHLTAVAAASLGRVIFVDDALLDYVQHGTNQIGARPHVPRRSRLLGTDHLAAYRRTSARMFHERRDVALLLATQGLLPWSLRKMFVTAERRNVPVLAFNFAVAIIKLLLRGEGRRAMLALRMFDAGIFFRPGGPVG